MAIRGGNGDVYAANCDLVTGNGYLNGVPGGFVGVGASQRSLQNMILIILACLHARRACKSVSFFLTRRACHTYRSKRRSKELVDPWSNRSKGLLVNTFGHTRRSKERADPRGSKMEPLPHPTPPPPHARPQPTILFCPESRGS